MNSISSTLVAKELKQVLFPALKEHGFTKFKGRTAFQYLDRVVIGFTTNAVGSYFSQVTGYTPMSFDATIWTHYDDIPAMEDVPRDKDGALLPKAMHRSYVLPVQMRTQARVGVKSDAEKEREDIWWVAPDGSNLSDLVEDLVGVYRDQGVRWRNTYSNLALALEEVDHERDCFDKFEFMFCLAQSIRHEQFITKYKTAYIEKMPKFVRECMLQRGYSLPT